MSSSLKDEKKPGTGTSRSRAFWAEAKASAKALRRGVEIGPVRLQGGVGWGEWWEVS